MIRIVLIFFLVVTHRQAWAQIQKPPLLPYEFYHIQQQDGLSFNFINCFLHDRDGFLWIGTNSGLNRFDGNHFTVFKHNPLNTCTLGNNTIHDICQDKDGHIWLATDNGISELDPSTGHFRNIHTIAGREVSQCLNVLCDRSGMIWFSAMHHGLFRYNKQTDTFTRFAHDPINRQSLSENYIAKNGLIEDPIRNGLWIATRRNGGLNFMDTATGIFQNYRNNPDGLPIYANHYTSAIALDDNKLIYADNIDRRIVFFDLKTRKIDKTITLVSQTGRDPFELSTIFVDRSHNLWISSWSYVMFWVEANTYQVKELMHDDTRRTSIASSSFWAGWQDLNGTIWLGTTNGISCTNPEQVLYDVYDLNRLFSPLKEGSIIGFLEDPDGSWWLQTYTRGLLHYSPTTNRLDTYRVPGATAEFPYGLLIHGIHAFGDELLMASPTSFLRFNKRTQKFKTTPLPPYIKANHVDLTSIQKQDDLIWFFGWNKQTFCYDLKLKKWHQYPINSTTTNPRFWVRKSMVDHKNNLWLELYPEGFARFSPQQQRFILDKEYDKEPIYENTLSSLAEDKNGYFWIASNGYGLVRYDPRTSQYRFWTEADGLGYDHCLAALPDTYGNIWVGAYNTFSVFTPARNRFFNITLPYNESTMDYYNFLWPLRSGHLLGAMKGYLIELKPERLSTIQPQKPTVLLNSLTSLDSTYLLTQQIPSIHLKATDNSFSIQFSVLSSLHEKQFRYSYKLENFDNQWVDSGAQATAWYNKLPGGNYEFKVKAISIHNQETPIRSLLIHIDTVFYKTPGFRALVLLSLIGLGLTLIRYRIKQTTQLHHLQVQATRLERDKTEIQYQNLINHLNPHFLFNSLTSLSSLIAIDPKHASRFLQKLSTIYRYILQNKDKETTTLDRELAFAKHYIDLQQTQFEDGLQISIDVPEAYLSYEIVPVTLQNLFENAIKHNTTEEDQPLLIWVYIDDTYLCIANNLQKKPIVKTSNKQGLDSLKKLYSYLSERPIRIEETTELFIVKIPLL